MLIQQQLIQHLGAVICDNKSVPCKRKFRGTFVPTRARIALKFILPRRTIPLLPHSSHILATSEIPCLPPSSPLLPRFFVSSLNFRRRYRAENLRNRNELFDDRR